MAFQQTLENLKAKPEHVRKRIAFFTSLGITAVIFTFWVSSFSIPGHGGQGNVATAVAKAGSPGQSMIAGVGNFFTDIKEMVFGAKKMTYSEVEVRAGGK